MSDRDRQIAERMGKITCEHDHDEYRAAILGRPKGWGNHHCTPFSPTTDANDREAAIAWLNERDTRVSITYAVAEERAVAVVIWGAIGFGKVTAPTVGEAFGGAFLAASEAIC